MPDGPGIVKLRVLRRVSRNSHLFYAALFYPKAEISPEKRNDQKVCKAVYILMSNYRAGRKRKAEFRGLAELQCGLLQMDARRGVQVSQDWKIFLRIAKSTTTRSKVALTVNFYFRGRRSMRRLLVLYRSMSRPDSASELGPPDDFAGGFCSLPVRWPGWARLLGDPRFFDPFGEAETGRELSTAFARQIPPPSRATCPAPEADPASRRRSAVKDSRATAERRALREALRRHGCGRSSGCTCTARRGLPIFIGSNARTREASAGRPAMMVRLPNQCVIRSLDRH